MSTYIITPEMQRENAEALLGKDPGRHKDPSVQFSRRQRRDKERDIKMRGADRPVTILNLNPFPLKINGGVYFPDEVPACAPGQPYQVYVIRNTRWGHRDLGCDQGNVMQMEPMPAVPMELASEYVREYVQQEGGFGGVLCYIGDQHPETIKKGEKVQVPEAAYGEDGELFIKVEERDFHQLLGVVRDKRNQSLMNRLQGAASAWEKDETRNLVGDNHRDMARMAFHEGLIPELPRFVMSKNTLASSISPCPLCAVVPAAANAIVCANCGHIFDVVGAYKNARIAYGAVEMDRLTAEEWKVVNKIKAERDRARGITAARGEDR